MPTPTVKRAGQIRGWSGGVIMKYRELAGLSQMELARRLGISQPLISSWECGRLTPSIYDITRLESVLGTELGEILLQIAYPKRPANE
jgi:transcriptional regulator with XRE-family HTH domain